MAEEKAIVKKSQAITEFIPFGGKDAIKLSVDMVRNMIAVPTKSKKYPTDNDCIKFIALCKARRLNPFEGDAFLIGYDTKDGPKFNLITAHQAFLKRAESHPEFDGMKSGIIVQRDEKVIDLEGDFWMEGDKVLGGWATVHFKNRTVPMHKRIRVQRFAQEWGIWRDDPAGMICKCAEADALRSSFPTIVGGMYLKEELEEKDAAKPAASEPMFNAEPPIEVEAKQVEQPPVEVTADSVRALCERDDIPENDLLVYCRGIMLADAKHKSLNQLPQESIATLIDQWEEISSKMKEEPGG